MASAGWQTQASELVVMAVVVLIVWVLVSCIFASMAAATSLTALLCCMLDRFEAHHARGEAASQAHV